MDKGIFWKFWSIFVSFDKFQLNFPKIRKNPPLAAQIGYHSKEVAMHAAVCEQSKMKRERSLFFCWFQEQQLTTQDLEFVVVEDCNLRDQTMLVVVCIIGNESFRLSFQLWRFDFFVGMIGTIAYNTRFRRCCGTRLC